ncbi:MAG: orotidine-5'-phosphate decarboxylase [Deltaproteobacteria bacterium]|nr:orotidine-5'-phosphate decarboxylase [Deltaproteobacteria bacterium]
MRSRLIFALDVGSVREALELVGRLAQEVGMFKVGKQLFLHAGPQIVRDIRDHGGEVFLDLKFHDIPRTVAKAGVEAARMGVRMFDLHASGSLEMMQRTVAEVAKVCRTEALRKPKILAVTVLTSLNRDDLKRVGIMAGVESQVVRLARLAKLAGMDGVVASPLEIVRIRKECGRGFIIVTPGVRGQDGEVDDQKRVMSSEDAVRAGADYLVVGRPIRDAADPAAAAREIVASMERGLASIERRVRLFSDRSKT